MERYTDEDGWLRFLVFENWPGRSAKLWLVGWWHLFQVEDNAQILLLDFFGFQKEAWSVGFEILTAPQGAYVESSSWIRSRSPGPRFRAVHSNNM